MSRSVAGFSSIVVLKLAGVTYRQLAHGARTGLVGSSIRQAAGHGSRRVYSFEDLVAVRVVARLLDAGVSLQAVRRAVEYLKRHTDRPLTTLALAAKGNRVFVLTGNPAKIIKATAQGQVVIAIDVQPIVKDLRSDVTELSRCTRDRRASAAPRLLGGAHTDVCRRRLRLAPMNTARSVGSMRMACSTRTCGSCPSSHSRYTVAVQMRSC